MNTGTNQASPRPLGWLRNVLRTPGASGLARRLWIWIASGWFLGAVANADDLDAPFVHVLIVADTNDLRIGKHVETDRRTVVSALEQAIPAHRRTLRVLDGDNATPQNVLQYYRDLKSQPNDTLLCYYAGHGAIDQKHGHVLTMQTANLSRKTLVQTVQAKQARLNIILTDCCAVFGQVPHAYAPTGYDPRTVRYLFFRHRGTVDVTASDLGQPAYGSQLGGIFTNAVFGMLSLSPEEVDQDGDAIPTWAELWTKAQASIAVRSQDLLARDRRLAATPVLKPEAQRPHAFSPLATPVGDAIPKPAARFGVRVAAGPGGEIRVVEAIEDSPAAWFGIQVGDAIMKLDGAEIRSPADFSNAISGKPENWPFPVSCELVRAADGAATTVRFRLAN